MFRFGALVGRIDAGDWFLLGTRFDAIVNTSGRLFLVYWDSNNGDNFGSVTALLDVNPSTCRPLRDCCCSVPRCSRSGEPTRPRR